jgi:hypothetical protein
MNPHLDQVGTLVKSVDGNKKLLAQMVQQGQIPHDIALLAGMRIDRLSKPQVNPGQQPTVLQQQFAPQAQMAPQGLAQLQQPQMPMQQAPQMPQAPVQAAEGGLMQLPVGNMFNENSYAGGGIIAFDEGGDVPGYAAGKFVTNKVGRYYDPAQLTAYDDAEIKKQLEATPEKSIDQIRKEQREAETYYGIKNLAPKQIAELQTERDENEKFRSMINANAGLAAAAELIGNTSQYFGPGAKAAATSFLSTKAAGEKEYKATNKDLRDMDFAINNAQQEMFRAQKTGDQAAYDKNRERRDSLMMKKQDLVNKTIETKNAFVGEKAKAESGYDTAIDAANVKAQGSGAGANAKVNKGVLEVAQKMMATAYPAGSMDLLFQKRPDVYQAELNRFIKGAETYIKTNVMPEIPPSNAVTSLLAMPGAGAKDKNKDSTVKPARETVTGKKVDPKIQSILNKYPASSAIDENENDD